MQLIQLSEPAAVDIKKTMSTLEKTLETSQMNGALADIEQDCATNKISPNQNDVLSKPVEDETQSSDKRAQFEDKIKDLNGIAKTNGDSKKNYKQDKDKAETEFCNDNIENGSSTNSKNNVNSTLSNPCGPINKPTDIVSSVVINNDLKEKNVNCLELDIDEPEKKDVIAGELKITNNLLNLNDLTDDFSKDDEKVTDTEKFNDNEISAEYEEEPQDVSTFSPNSQKNVNDLELDVDVQEQQDVSTGDLKVTDNLLNSKDLTDDVSIDNGKKVTTTEKLKDDDISVVHEEMPQYVSAFSPNSDTIENDINISAQLQQLEDDTLMDDAGNPSKNDKPASPLKKEEKEIQPPTTEQKESNGVNRLEEQEEKDHSDRRSRNENTQLNGASELTSEMQPTGTIEEKLENNADIDDSTQNNSENVKASDIAIEKQLLENEQNDSSIAIIMDDIKPVPTEETLDNSNNGHNIVEDIPSVQKYIKVRNFTDMVDQIASDNETGENSEVADISVEKHHTQDEIMDVDNTDDISLVTTENNNGLNNASENLPFKQKETKIEKHVEMTDKEMTKDIAEENQSETPGPEAKQITMIEKTDDDDVVMEVDDAELVSDKEKTIPDTTIDNSVAQNTVAVKETTKQDTVINIIDKEDENINNSKLVDGEIKNDEAADAISIEDSVKDSSIKEFNKCSSKVDVDKKDTQEQVSEKKNEKPLPVVCKLSNTMDILSDDEDDPLSKKPSEEKENKDLKKGEQDNKCINLDDDDDIMFIEDSNSQDTDDIEKPDHKSELTESQTIKSTDAKINTDTAPKNEENSTLNQDDSLKIIEKDDSTSIETASQPKEEETKTEPTEMKETTPPLITKTFLKTVTRNLADMTRDELEDFCILKLVESVVDKSNLNEIKIKMKNMSETLEDLKKKSLALLKQNRDLQVVVKTVQEDQKKRTTSPLMPMKITRSVGMQVVLSSTEKSILKKKLSTPLPPPVTPARPVRNVQSPKTPKPTVNNIPVPRLVPASSPTNKTSAAPASAPKTVPRNTTPQRPEKRPHSKASPASSVTVDLTDDEPPTKMNSKNPTPPVRLVPPQNLMPKNRPQFGPTGSPRKVYIPISSNNPNIRPPPAVIKNFIPPPRPRPPGVVRMQTVRMNQAPALNRHPAPLPDAMKQYQPPIWKALPPAPDLKLSKVDNGIVISWKFEGYQADTYEEVASFQLYAYQETPAPPSTALWKKIGDIKALPLPMACTLTQFMSGFKYYFAVRAIDVRSRMGPFSLPGSIMLISKS